MRGLKKPEGNEFNAFFQIVQSEAKKQDAIFFLECGEGNDFAGENIEGEDLRGWLIPEKQADEFEREWLAGDPGDKWEDCIVWAVWSGSVNNPAVKIKQF